ncbi:Maltodextrose utilization protein malA [Listeria monocytogenes N53-1]|nr:Maltodextrose utilization protein malA [Listeria monocytogenes]CCQ24822.1 Maltodextrose utilization protein malA [Listeria monocytogenes N53-1]
MAGVNLTKAELSGAKNVINFKDQEMTLTDASGYTFEVSYPKDATLSEITSGESLVDWVSAQWYLENQAFVFLSMVLMIGSIIFVSSLMLTVFTTLFIWMTKRSSFSSIASFKESINLTLNALGIPVIAACIIGFIYFDITIIMAVQSLGMVLMIAWTFLKTRFYKTSEKSMAASR